MSRPLRIQYPDAFYHVINRGAGRTPIYLIDDDYGIFLEALKESVKRFNARVICYCLMPNHYHLLLQTPMGNLSRVMRHINGVYTQRFNRYHKKDGPLFRGRYKAILVQEDEYLTHLIRYIHLNPVTANLAPDPSRYPWTSHGDYLKGKDLPDWLYVRLGLAFFSDKLKEAQDNYRKFLRTSMDPRILSFYTSKKQQPILADADFIEAIKNKQLTTDDKISTEISQERTLKGALLVKRIIKEVSRAFKVPIEAIYQSQRAKSNHARFTTLYLAREISGLKLTEIASLFKINTYRTVGTGCYRFKKLLDRDAALRRRYEEIKGECSQGKT